MSITAKELAGKLGLSESSVSIVLNNRPGVSTATRNRVLEAAREYGYDLTRRAVKLGTKKGTICFVIYKKSGAVVDDTPFFTTLSDGVGMGCKSGGYDFVIRYFYEDDDFDEQLFMLRMARFSGIILLATEMNENSISRFSQVEIPIVVLDAYFETIEHNYILINNVQGAYLATTYLIAKRRSQPGYLRSVYLISNFCQRADGFYKAVRDRGMSTSKSPVHRLSPSQEGAYFDMKQVLESKEELATCYFADNDHIAIGAMKALAEAGYRIPEDIAVVGFDDLPLCEFVTPSLTTIHVPAQYMGQTAAKRITQIIEDKNHLPLKIEVSTTLRKRKSV